MSDINRVIIIGNLTRDPELKYLQSGTVVTKFSIANNKTYNLNGEKKKETSFFEVVAWSKLAELVGEYCKKGNRVCIEGRLQQKSWDDSEGKKRYAIEIVVENIQFLSNNNNGEINEKQSDNSASPQVEETFSDDGSAV